MTAVTTSRAFHLMGYQAGIKKNLGKMIGFGGLSFVYELHLPGRRPLGIKISKAAAGERGVAFLQREANVLARFDNPHIVKAHGLGTCPDPNNQDSSSPVSFMIMDLIPGFSLNNYAGKMSRCLSPLEAFLIGKQVAEALQLVHQAGFSYNDLKPENIMFIPGTGHVGQVVLIDFSLAEITGHQLTAETVLGTYGFIAPEKLLGRPRWADNRSDIFSLGIALYKLLFNELPILSFRNESFFSACNNVLPNRIRAKRLPLPFEKVLLQMTALEPKDRYQNCTAVIAAIDEALTKAG